MGIIVNSNIISENSYSKSEIDSKISNINTDLNLKADKSTTLSGYGIADALGYNNISNCITKIPQNIKLELLEDGTITLKAGSIVYIPNGIGLFEEKHIDEDVSLLVSNYGTQSNILLWYRETTNILSVQGKTLIFSGETAPTGSTYMTWYDTVNNIIKTTGDGGNTWNNLKSSFPIASITSTNNVITSIDKIFNGFGYIGEIVFSLPNIECIIPNGLNEDGTYNNIILKTDKVLTKNETGSFDRFLCLSSNNEIEIPETKDVLYDANKNILYYKNNVVKWCICSSYSSIDKKISVINLGNVFKVASENELSQQVNGLGYNNVSNCILNISQDIIVSLANDGTFTLKSGSAVYIPDGVNNFTKKVIDQDISINALQTYTGICNVYYTLSEDGFNYAFFANTSSGTSDNIPNSGLYYNTEENSIDYYENGAKVKEKCSFPLCSVRCENGVIKEILHVFNGIGYIGSTLYALPGIKGLIPDGKNADGTLKSIETSINSVLVGKTNGTSKQAIILNSSTIQSYTYNVGTPKNGFISYSEYENYVYVNEITSPCLIVGYLQLNDGNIDFTVKNVFNIPDNDLLNVSPEGYDLISKLGMPSDNYIDLELLASESTYTAPANGYFSISKAVESTTQYIRMDNQKNGINCNGFCSAANNQIRLFLPVKKDDKVLIVYSASGNLERFRFIYAEGSSL